MSSMHQSIQKKKKKKKQFGTCAYFMTPNVLYTPDGHGWVMRDWDRIGACG